MKAIQKQKTKNQRKLIRQMSMGILKKNQSLEIPPKQHGANSRISLKICLAIRMLMMIDNNMYLQGVMKLNDKILN
jgi:hypothetical protein